MKRLLVAVFFLAGTLFAQVYPPDLSIRHVTLITTTPIDFSERQQIIHGIKARKEQRAPIDALVSLFQGIAKDQFQSHGYFKAAVSDPQIEIVETNAQRDVVDLILQVNPGDKYRLGSISFESSSAFSVDQLRHQFPIADGDLFEIFKMRTGLENLRKLYGDHGYIMVSAVPNTTIDETNHGIAVLIDIDEGHVYRLGQLLIDGDEWRPGTKAKMLRDWQRYVGRPYGPGVLEEFLRDQHLASKVDPHLLFAVQTVSSSESITAGNNPPYVINVRITLANPEACRPAPPQQNVRMCWLVDPQGVPQK